MKKLLILTILLASTNCFADNWECINRNGLFPSCNTWRWNVPNGWLVSTDNGDRHISIAYMPDEKHEWKI